MERSVPLAFKMKKCNANDVPLGCSCFGERRQAQNLDIAIEYILDPNYQGTLQVSDPAVAWNHQQSMASSACTSYKQTNIEEAHKP